MVRGETMVSTVSRFVKEIPESLIDPDRENIYIQKKKPDYESYGASSISSRDNFNRKPFGTGTAGGFSLGSKPKQQFEVKSGGSLDYSVGDQVRHIKFGIGTVLEINKGGRDYEVTVDFEEFGVKKMFAGFAKLVKVD